MLGPLFRTAGHKVRTQFCVTVTAGQRRGDVHLCLRICGGARSERVSPTADNQNIFFLPTICTTSHHLHGKFLHLLFLQAHRETEEHCIHCHWTTRNTTRTR